MESQESTVEALQEALSKERKFNQLLRLEVEQLRAELLQLKGSTPADMETEAGHAVEDAHVSSQEEPAVEDAHVSSQEEPAVEDDHLQEEEAEEEEVDETNLAAVAGELEGNVFIGKVKSYSAKVGRGFIECEEMKAAIDKDIYVHGSVLANAGANVGDTVQFKLHVNPQGLPQAQAPLTLVECGADQAQHQGTVKSFSEKSGYGFVECSETYAQYGRDVYLPAEKLISFQAWTGQEVLFNVSLNRDGMPVVAQVWPVDRSLLGGAANSGKDGGQKDGGHKGGKSGGHKDGSYKDGGYKDGGYKDGGCKGGKNSWAGGDAGCGGVLGPGGKGAKGAWGNGGAWGSGGKDSWQSPVQAAKGVAKNGAAGKGKFGAKGYDAAWHSGDAAWDYGYGEVSKGKFGAKGGKWKGYPY